MIIFRIVSYLLASWLLVHLLAVFGVFLAFAYPIWWLLSPRRLPCIWCRIKKATCCAFSHSLLNAGIVMFFSLISVALIFAESRILFKLGFPPTPKTVSFIIPAKGQYRLGEIFPMKVEIAGIKKPINAVQADLGFDPVKLQVKDVSTKESFANIFIQKEINNEAGYVRLTGGLPNPGFFADRGVFGTIFFEGVTPGVVKVELLPSSMVLANDGRGSNVLKDLLAVSYLVLPEKITPEEEEMQKKLLLNSQTVLGEEMPPAPGAQIQFYEEIPPVLGTQVGSQPVKQEGVFRRMARTLVTVLGEIDLFIISSLSKIIGH